MLTVSTILMVLFNANGRLLPMRLMDALLSLELTTNTPKVLSSLVTRKLLLKLL